MNFKEYIGTVVEANSSDSIFSKIKSGDIPLSPKVLEGIFEIKNEEYYHLTDLSFKPKMEKLQGSRKTISCFNKWNRSDIFNGAAGIEYDFNALFILQGNYTFKMPEDFYTDFDKQGRRWIQWYEIGYNKMMSFYENLSDKIKDDFMSQDFGVMTSKEVSEKIYSVQWDSIDGKTKAIIIKNYLDSTEKVLKKYKKKINEFMSEETEYYNEILGYNFKIKGIKMQGEDFFNYLLDDQFEFEDGAEEFDKDYEEFEDDLFGKKELQVSKQLLREANKMGITLYQDLNSLIQSLK